MPAPLTADGLARLGEAARTLLSPLTAPSVDDWRRDAARSVCAALGAETGAFTLPGRPRTVEVHALDDDVQRAAERYLAARWSERGPAPDPILDRFYNVIVRQRIGVWDMHVADRLLGGTGAAWENQFCQEVLRPNGLDDTNALTVRLGREGTARGAATLAVHNFHQAPAPGEHLAALGLLLPAFEAGLDAVARLDARRTELDALTEPVAVYGADGREHHRNAALEALLTADPDRCGLLAALGRTAEQLRALGFGRAGDDAPCPSEDRVRTRGGAYRLRGTLLGTSVFDPDGAVLVSVVAEAAPTLPGTEALRERYGLTPREAEVALLVAEGLSNAAVAERLFVSPHTARHHTEQVFAKLDLGSRSALALTLLQPG